MKLFKILSSIILILSLISISGQAEEIIKIDGSSICEQGFVLPAKDLIEEMLECKIELSANGNESAIQALIKNKIDLAFTSRKLTKKEKRRGLIAHKIATEAFIIIINKENRVVNLNKKDLSEIFSGKKTNWNKFGGDNLPITIITGADFTSVAEFVDNIILKNRKLSTDAIIANSAQEIIHQVQNIRGGFGIVRLNFLNDKVKPIAVNRNIPSGKNIMSGKYCIQRTLNVVTSPESSELAQQIVDWFYSRKGKEFVCQQFIPIERVTLSGK